MRKFSTIQGSNHLQSNNKVFIIIIRETLQSMTHTFINIFKILILLCVIHNCCPQYDQQSEFTQQSFADMASRIFAPQSNQKLYPNLFTVHKQLIVQTQLVYLPSSAKSPQVIKQRNTSIILEQDYLKMYANRLSFKFILEVDEVVKGRTADNTTFLKVNFYVLAGGRYFKIAKQSLAMVEKFKQEWREGVEVPVMADIDLVTSKNNNEPEGQLMVLNNMEIFLFEMSDQLPFTSNSTQLSLNPPQGFDFFKDPHTGQTYYFPCPVSQRVNSLLKQNYTPFKEFASNPTHRLSISIKISPSLFPLSMFYVQRLSSASSIHQDLQAHLNDNFLGQEIPMMDSYIVRYIKLLLLNSKMWPWVFVMGHFASLMLSGIMSFFGLMFAMRMFRNIEVHEGISLYLLFTVVGIYTWMLVVGCLVLREQNFITNFMGMMIGIWAVRKIATVQLLVEFPFVKAEYSQWYNAYSQKDKQVFTKVGLVQITLITLFTLYPLIFQNYLNSPLSQTQPLALYLLSRTIIIIDQYKMILILLPQIVLNFNTKSAKAIPYKVIICMLPLCAIDNFLLPVTSSIVQMVFYLKEEICLVMLIAQKIMYGDNVEGLKGNQEDARNMRTNQEYRGNNENREILQSREDVQNKKVVQEQQNNRENGKIQEEGSDKPNFENIQQQVDSQENQNNQKIISALETDQQVLRKQPQGQFPVNSDGQYSIQNKKQEQHDDKQKTQ